MLTQCPPRYYQRMLNIARLSGCSRSARPSNNTHWSSSSHTIVFKARETKSAPLRSSSVPTSDGMKSRHRIAQSKSNARHGQSADNKIGGRKFVRHNFVATSLRQKHELLLARLPLGSPSLWIQGNILGDHLKYPSRRLVREVRTYSLRKGAIQYIKKGATLETDS